MTKQELIKTLKLSTPKHYVDWRKTTAEGSKLLHIGDTVYEVNNSDVDTYPLDYREDYQTKIL